MPCRGGAEFRRPLTAWVPAVVETTVLLDAQNPEVNAVMEKVPRGGHGSGGGHEHSESGGDELHGYICE